MIPTFLGEVYYPAGFPLPADRTFQEGVSMEEIKLKYLEEKATPEETESLKEYVLYYIGAPCFQLDFENPAQEELFKNMPLDNILDVLLDAGIDPL